MVLCSVGGSSLPKSHEGRKLYGAAISHALTKLKQLAVLGGCNVTGTNSILPPRETGVFCV